MNTRQSYVEKLLSKKYEQDTYFNNDEDKKNKSVKYNKVIKFIK